MIFDKSILSRSQKLADADPIGTLDSCSGSKNEQKNTQNTVIENESEHYICKPTESHHMRTLCQRILRSCLIRFLGTFGTDYFSNC